MAAKKKTQRRSARPKFHEDAWSEEFGVALLRCLDGSCTDAQQAAIFRQIQTNSELRQQAAAMISNEILLYQWGALKRAEEAAAKNRQSPDGNGAN